MSKKRLYRILFINQGKIYELYAKKITQDKFYGFIEVHELVFGEKTSIVVDPSEERLKSEFDGVSCLHVPLQAVIRIDEVEKQGTAKIIPFEKGEAIGSLPSHLTPTGSKPPNKE
jgi:hypothetical protein